MIATDHVVFLHLHKSGGTFVNEGLLRFVEGARTVGYHLPRRLIPSSLAHLPVIGLVRNPWSYYVSWYSFQASRPQPNALFRVLSDNGRLDFESTIRNALELGSGSDRLEPLLEALPREYTHRGVNLPAFALEPIRQSGMGFYSYLYRYMYDGAGVLYLGRMEQMRDELISLFTAAGQPVSGPLRAYLQSAPASNTSDHAAYTEYYGDQLAQLVAERDGSIIKQFGYKFGG